MQKVDRGSPAGSSPAGGKSGLRGPGRSLTTTRGNSRESAAEKTPPMTDESQPARGGWEEEQARVKS